MSDEPFQKPSQNVSEAGMDPLSDHVLPHTRDELIAGKVEAFAGMGFTVDEMAIELDIRPGQIRMHYARELGASAINANLAVAQALHKAATDGNVSAQKYWLENRAGDQWSKDNESGPAKVIVEVRQV